MADIFCCQDPIGHTVCLDEDHWVTHVIVERVRAFLAGQEAAVELTISDPITVTRDRNDADRFNYYRPFALQAPYDRVYLKVCVRFVWQPGNVHDDGFVVTAYPVDQVHPREDVIYDRLQP